MPFKQAVEARTSQGLPPSSSRPSCRLGRTQARATNRCAQVAPNPRAQPTFPDQHGSPGYSRSARARKIGPRTPRPTACKGFSHPLPRPPIRPNRRPQGPALAKKPRGRGRAERPRRPIVDQATARIAPPHAASNWPGNDSIAGEKGVSKAKPRHPPPESLPGRPRTREKTGTEIQQEPLQCSGALVQKAESMVITFLKQEARAGKGQVDGDTPAGSRPVASQKAAG